MTMWQLQEAKAKLSEFVSKAKASPQFISRHGKPEVVTMSIEKYNQLTGEKQSLVDFFRESPLCGLDLDFQRDKRPGRDIHL